jgi:hypothetical protein
MTVLYLNGYKKQARILQQFLSRYYQTHLENGTHDIMKKEN